MAASYVVQEEDGTSKILQEEGTGYVIQEESTPDRITPIPQVSNPSGAPFRTR